MTIHIVDAPRRVAVHRIVEVRFQQTAERGLPMSQAPILCECGEVVTSGEWDRHRGLRGPRLRSPRGADVAHRLPPGRPMTVSLAEYHRMLARDMREDALVSAIVRLATGNGWRVVHQLPANAHGRYRTAACRQCVRSMEKRDRVREERA